jgi:hypothetical protein
VEFFHGLTPVKEASRATNFHSPFGGQKTMNLNSQIASGSINGATFAFGGLQVDCEVRCVFLVQLGGQI